MLTVVNMIPNQWSDEENQDCEPNLSVNPADPKEIIGTTFTYDNPAGTSAVSPAMSGNWAPLFSSTDGGKTWTLEFVLPSASGDQYPTWDVTSRYAGGGDELYSGLISPGGFTILINRAPNASTQQSTIGSVTGDQPFLEATTQLGEDKLYVGYNQNSNNSTVDVFLDANAASPTFSSNLLDVRNSSNMPPTRTAIHSSGTIYCAFYSNNPDGTRDVVVVKDLDWGASGLPFHALVDGGDGQIGVRVAISISNPWAASDFLDPTFGNDRYGPDLAIAVDPRHASRVYVAYVTGTGSSDEMLHLRGSKDGGQNWSPDVRTVPVAKNPSIAINSLGMVGFVYQQVVGGNWVTVFEKSDDGFVSSFLSHTLASTPTSTPVPASLYATYLGDYIKLQAIGKDFFGTFCASNAPFAANFPSGVHYQRNVDWATHTLLANDDVTPVAVSIDPFFFKLTVDVPGIATAIADSGFFGKVCVGSFADETLTINNHGSGTLRIPKIVSTSPDFEPPSVLSYPLEIAPGDSIELTIRFKPTSFSSASGQIEVYSNAPSSPHLVDVSGEAPAGKIAISGSLCFGGVNACCRAERTLTICNVGDCGLDVTGVAFKRKSPYWKLINSPFPATLRPGACMGVVIRYKAMEKCPTACELIIESNDPVTPAKTLDVMGYTIWNQCGCGQTCNDCQRGCCTKHSDRCCCQGRADDCWQDEDEGKEC